MWVTCSSQLFDGWPVFVLFFWGRLLVVMLIGWRAATYHVLSLLVGEGLSVITVEPAVQRFSRESEAFGSSF